MLDSVPTKFTFILADVVVAVFHANKGEGLLKHSHEYNHATMCNAGSCKISLKDRHYIIDKNSQPMNLPAGEWHEIEALENGTVFVNVFAEGKQ
jgi:quercetin dioxygenase-like cupin family protein